MRLTLGLLLALSACGGSSDKNGGDDDPSLTQESVHEECVQFCNRRTSCYKDVCNEDYPGKVLESDVSMTQEDCLAQLCETTVYLDIKKKGGAYITCTNTASCRELTTGTCKETAECTSEVGSTPYLPGTTQKAPPPDDPSSK